MRKVHESLITFTEKKFKVDARYFINGGFWLSAGQAITITFGLITTALLANYLSEANYGIYKYLIALSTIITTFSLTGIGQSILQTAAKGYKNFYRENLSIIFKFNLLIGFIGIVGAIYYWTNANTTLAIGCLLIALLQPITQTFQYTPAYLNGRQKFKMTTKIHLFRMIFTSTLTLFTLFYTQSILWLFFVYILGNLITNFITYLFFIKKNNDTTPSNITVSYLNYAKHTSLINLIGGTAAKADSIIVFTYLGAIELALYSIATVMPEQIKGSLKNLSALLMPKYAKITNTDILIKTLPKRSLQLLAILVSITFIYVLLAPFVYEILFPKYPNAILFSQLAALAFPSFIGLLPHSILKAKLANTELHKINIYNSIIQLILVLIGATLYGVIGVILAIILRRYIVSLLFYYFTYKL